VSQSVGGVGLTRRDSVRIRRERADVRSPHAIRNARLGSGRGAPRRDMVAGSHGLSRERDGRDQRGGQERYLGHLFSPYGDEAQESRASSWEVRSAFAV
jgi:hypothetical protein